MAIVRPFRGLVYSTARIPQLQPVVAPPYDVIGPDAAADYRARDPHNIVHVDLPEGDSPERYALAASRLDAWRKDSILEQDPAPGFYVTSQRFAPRGMPERTRWGFMGLLRITEDSEGVVLPHEKTLDAPRNDRLELMAATRSQLSPIFVLYSDPEGTLSRTVESTGQRQPDRWLKDDGGVDTRLWRLSDPAVLSSITGALESHRIWIADGHHRYAAARDLRDRLRAEDPDAPATRGAAWVLAYFSSMDASGLTILPYHRGIRDIEDFELRALLQQLDGTFDVKRFVFEGYEQKADQIRRRLREMADRGRQCFGLYAGGSEFHLLLPKEGDESPSALRELPECLRTLDIEVLHRGILEPVFGLSPANIRAGGALRFTDDAARAIGWVEAGEAQAAFFVNPTRKEQLMAVSLAGLQMPPKSTYFFPKVLTGLVFNPLDDPGQGR